MVWVSGAPMPLARRQTQHVWTRSFVHMSSPAAACCWLQENVARLPDGLVFVADRQLGGKGGHWQQLSCACRPKEQVALVVGMAWYGMAWHEHPSMCTWLPCRAHGMIHLAHGILRCDVSWPLPCRPGRQPLGVSGRLPHVHRRQAAGHPRATPAVCAVHCVAGGCTGGAG